MNWGCKLNLFHNYIVLNNHVKNKKEIDIWMKNHEFLFYENDLSPWKNYWCKETQYGKIIFTDYDLISWHGYDHEIKICKKCKRVVNSFDMELTKLELTERLIKAEQKLKDEYWAKEQLKIKELL